MRNCFFLIFFVTILFFQQVWYQEQQEREEKKPWKEKSEWQATTSLIDFSCHRDGLPSIPQSLRLVPLFCFWSSLSIACCLSLYLLMRVSSKFYVLWSSFSCHKHFTVPGLLSIPYALSYPAYHRPNPTKNRSLFLPPFANFFFVFVGSLPRSDRALQILEPTRKKHFANQSEPENKMAEASLSMEEIKESKKLALALFRSLVYNRLQAVNLATEISASFLDCKDDDQKKVESDKTMSILFRCICRLQQEKEEEFAGLLSDLGVSLHPMSISIDEFIQKFYGIANRLCDDSERGGMTVGRLSALFAFASYCAAELAKNNLSSGELYGAVMRLNAVLEAKVEDWITKENKSLVSVRLLLRKKKLVFHDFS